MPSFLSRRKNQASTSAPPTRPAPPRESLDNSSTPSRANETTFYNTSRADNSLHVAESTPAPTSLRTTTLKRPSLPQMEKLSMASPPTHAQSQLANSTGGNGWSSEDEQSSVASSLMAGSRSRVSSATTATSLSSSSPYPYADASQSKLQHQQPDSRPSLPFQTLPVPAGMNRDGSSSEWTLASLKPCLPSTYSTRQTSSRYALTDFRFLRTLGTGSFGRVHLVRSCHNARHYAIKVLNKERVVNMKQVEHTNSEREMLERVRHPFLINLWGTFKDAHNIYVVMDFVSGGELFSLLRKSQRFPDPVAKFFAAEVALALDYLHSLDIIYRDLKPENILLAADGHIKITDFGFAKYVPDNTWTLCGTPDYLAPEIVQSRGYNKSVDWYALGILIFEMLAGYPPFFTEDSNPMRLYEKIIAGKIRYPSYFTCEAQDLLKCLLTSDLSKRYGNLANGSRDIFAHPCAEVDWERLYKKEIPAPYVPRIENDGDASCFEAYQEIDVLAEYGRPGPDPFGSLFPLF